jgi:predicted nucleotide-binding protein (sugar kinase/HSP70/actin superfamily)
MKPEERRVGFPVMGGTLVKVVKRFLKELDMEVVEPPPITQETIKKGVKLSPDMICFPYKVTLGSIMECLDKGANTILQQECKGDTNCRQKQFATLQDYQLRRAGYDNFEIHGVNIRNMVQVASKISGKPMWETARITLRVLNNLEIEDSQTWDDQGINIGILAEVYCGCDETVNYKLEEKLRKFGANPYNTSNVSAHLARVLSENPLNPIGLAKMTSRLFSKDDMKEYKKEAHSYFHGDLGGHAIPNVEYLLWLKDRGVDGIVHVLPLSCMPETTVEPYINGICADHRIPLLRIPIDENNSEANLETRLETFVEMIKLRKAS